MPANIRDCRTARFDRPRLQPPVCTSSDGSGGLCPAHCLHEHCDPQFARASVRQQEIAIRAALGASRWRVLSQLLTKSVLLSLLGGAGGAILSIVSLRLLRNTLPADVQWFCDTSTLKFNGTAFAFTLLLAVVSGVLSGLAPAWKYSKADPTRALATESHRMPGAATTNGVPHWLLLKSPWLWCC